MKFGEVIHARDPRPDRNRQVRVKFNGINYELSHEGEEMPFAPDMFKLRGQGANPDEMRSNLEGRSGHLFANLGVSAAVVGILDGVEYQLLITQLRDADKDFKDKGLVRKNISGYTKSDRERLDFARTINGEIEEEFVPFIDTSLETGLIIPVSFGGACRTPYDPFCLDGSGNIYASRLPIIFEESLNPFFKGDSLILKSIPDRALLERVIFSSPTSYGQPGVRLMFHSPTNSVQAIGFYYVDLGQLRRVGATLRYAEDRINKEVPADRNLETKISADSKILFFKMAGEIGAQKLTGEVYTMVRGVLVPYQGDAGELLLSEAFAPHDRGVVTVGSIRFSEYLANQERR